ncbi:tRNA-(ms[2]io[6]A)-hydroxylase [Enhygromyxa salina]|uniref:tRNA-(Ms[2]io[6]A)-hydroxylase n=1 Tax=Enhygromyxa salina TaxID=215803 RepID=A0A0C1ZXL8_9BACT|nr:tRNA-(ms[2]io[6]A)-hydroxylase [Enhygromyxa salina]KIG15918.1 tRNA-(ms[2]io[6]A)-hydroxylase [Enhygromyxa salina]
MLHLAAGTDERWGQWALEHMDAILLDHAHCEKKAASTALSMIFRYPDRPQLMMPMSALAREELEHFEQVVALIRRRGGEFVRQEPSPYAARLMAATRKHEPGRLLDILLCCSLIEARSCERMQLIAGALAERGGDAPGHELHELYGLYNGLLVSEARHHATYVELARGCVQIDEAELQGRLAELAAHEASVIEAAPREQPRMHN